MHRYEMRPQNIRRMSDSLKYRRYASIEHIFCARLLQHLILWNGFLFIITYRFCFMHNVKWAEVPYSVVENEFLNTSFFLVGKTFNKAIKNVPSALLSYIGKWKFSKT